MRDETIIVEIGATATSVGCIQAKETVKAADVKFCPYDDNEGNMGLTLTGVVYEWGDEHSLEVFLSISGPIATVEVEDDNRDHVEQDELVENLAMRMVQYIRGDRT